MSRTFDESGRPIKGAQRAGNRARDVSGLGQSSGSSTDYVDFGLTPQAASSGWGTASSSGSTDSSAQGPNLGPLPTVTITPSGSTIPWWVYLLGAVAIGYVLGHMFHGRVQGALSKAASY